jgi:hypothetical protein
MTAIAASIEPRILFNAISWSPVRYQHRHAGLARQMQAVCQSHDAHENACGSSRYDCDLSLHFGFVSEFDASVGERSIDQAD